MVPYQQEVLDGVATLIRHLQRRDPGHLLSVILFNSEVDVAITRRAACAVTDDNVEAILMQYQPNGGSAVVDALLEVGPLMRPSDRTPKVTLISDAIDNSSQAELPTVLALIGQLGVHHVGPAHRMAYGLPYRFPKSTPCKGKGAMRAAIEALAP